jgi:hypothetical protein
MSVKRQKVRIDGRGGVHHETVQGVSRANAAVTIVSGEPRSSAVVLAQRRHASVIPHKIYRLDWLCLANF